MARAGEACCWGVRCRFGTVVPPAFSKNVITVGAVYSTYLDIPDGQNYVTYFSSRGDNSKGR